MAKKTYTKVHKSASAATKHTKKIRKRGGKVKVVKQKKGYNLKYSF